jgi:hypothetical protein
MLSFGKIPLLERSESMSVDLPDQSHLLQEEILTVIYLSKET